MFRARTVREQILPVLSTAREYVDRGHPVPEACQIAINARHEEIGLTYQTIEDGCRRRLGLRHVGEFHRMVATWIEEGCGDLKNLLLRRSEASAHSDIRVFFEEFSRQTGRSSIRSPSLTASRGETAASPTGHFTITANQLDSETLAALRERGRMSGRTLEAEIKAILTQAARSGRREFATWAAGFRSRLRDRHVGNVTADIRLDRGR